MLLLVLYISVALGFSFLCSILEAVLLSITPSYIASLREHDPKLGKRLARLKDQIDQPLAAILSLNTVAHTVGAAGAGAQATALFGDVYFGVISAVLTLLILVVSEIIPKTLGAMYWRELAGVVSRVLPVVVFSMYPLVLLSRVITRLLSRGAIENVVSRDEISALARLGLREGVLDAHEATIMQSLLRSRAVITERIMTPRTVMFSLPASMTVAQVLEQHPHIRYSRIPLQEVGEDQITQYILKYDLLRQAAEGDKTAVLGSFARPLLIVLEQTRLAQLFERFLETQEHIALVVDEYGATSGLVTVEDVVETLLGHEIVDETDQVPDLRALAQKRARRKWKLR